jgi:hypothetical protein
MYFLCLFPHCSSLLLNKSFCLYKSRIPLHSEHQEQCGQGVSLGESQGAARPGVGAPLGRASTEPAYG